MFDVIQTEHFKQDVEFYVRKKKYFYIQDDLNAVTKGLENGNLIGDEIPGLKLESDGHTYKVRAVNTDTHSGKSNGYRIIYYVVRDDCEIFLLTIYSKKDGGRIPANKEVVKLIAEYCM